MTRPEWAAVAGLSLVGGAAVLVFWRPIVERFVREMGSGAYGAPGRFQLRLYGRPGTAFAVLLLGCMMVGVGALAVRTCLASP